VLIKGALGEPTPTLVSSKDEGHDHLEVDEKL
jgi:hypothetical protein